ncbi:hypothetical protein BBJ28_00012897 [Nothophytophthora sp. Chile5]|nr:hypothetical protein BBJ28_00012897 [Nothophytophthora sp. Chile5]
MTAPAEASGADTSPTKPSDGGRPASTGGESPLAATAEHARDVRAEKTVGGDSDEDEEGDGLGDGEAAEPQELPIRAEPLAQQLASPEDVDAGLQLIELCRDGELQAVVRLVREGAPAGFITKSGWTPLAAAAASGCNEVLLYLLDIGADGMYETSASKQDDHPLSARSGPNSGRTSPSYAATGGNTPLHWACYKGHVDTVSLLLAAGFQAEATDTSGNRCLHLACSGGHRNVVELLLAHSAAVEPRNMYGNRALDLATDPDCRRLLARFQAQNACEWCKESFSRLRRPSLCQNCHNVYCDTKPCSSSSSSVSPTASIDQEQGGSEGKRSEVVDVAAALALAISKRYCQECATEMGKAEQDLRHVLESKLELIRRTLAVLDPSLSSSRPSTTASVGSSAAGRGGEVKNPNAGEEEGEGESTTSASQQEGDAASSMESGEAGEVSANADVPREGDALEDTGNNTNGASSATGEGSGDGEASSTPSAGETPAPSENVVDPEGGEADERQLATSSRSSKQRSVLISNEAIQRVLTLTQTDAEALYTALEAAQLKAADAELLRVSRQTYRQLVAHVALQEEVKALLAVRPIGIRSLLEPLKRALQRAVREQVHPAMLTLAVQIVQSAEAECTLFGCHALCDKIERGSRRHAKDIARLEASLTEARARAVNDKLLVAADALRDRLNADVRLEACLLPFTSPLAVENAPTTAAYVFGDGTTFDTLLQALEHRTQLVSTAVDVGSAVEGVSPALLEEGATLLKQLKKDVRDETKAEEERRKAEEEAALKAAKKGKKKKA